MGMNIAIDVQPLYSWHSTRGIGSYTKDLIMSLLKNDRSNTYYLVNFYSEISTESDIGCYFNMIEINYYKQAKDYLCEVGNPKSRKFFSYIVSELIKDRNIDIYLLCAAVDQFDIYDITYFQNVKLVTIMYDLIPMIFADKYLINDYVFKYYQCLKLYTGSDAILAISNSSAQDTVDFLYYPKERIHTIYGGISARFQKNKYSKKEIDNIKKKFSIYKEYLFCVGADDFRKNLDGLAHAFLNLSEQLLERFQLVITCSVSTETQNRICKKAEDCGRKDSIVFTNYVNDQEMLCLLNSAKLSVFPSMYEGFGLPVVEAWRCEIPVVTSNNSSLGEIARDAAITIDPFSSEEITKGIEYALTKADLNDLVIKGKMECQKYTWDCVVKALINIYNDIADTNKIDISSIHYRRNLVRIRSKCLKNISIKSRLKYFIRKRVR